MQNGNSLFLSTHNKSRVKDEITTDARNYITAVSQPQRSQCFIFMFNPLNAELNPICHLLALLGAYLILRVSRVRVNIEDVSALCSSGVIILQ
jgi:hypothetical protein